MSTTKIVELFIDDEFDESGIEAISLVSRPAHDETWLAFSADTNNEEKELASPYHIAEENFCDNNPKFNTLGEAYTDLMNEGWEVVKMEKITPQMVHKMERERFASDPNGVSQLDTDEIRVRYKYIGPNDTVRDFCKQMMSQNRVYRIEDIEGLSNPEFGTYSIFLFRGSYGCRHAWVRLIYKKQGKIINSGSSTRNRIEGTEEVVVAADTRPLRPKTWRENNPEKRDGSQYISELNKGELSKQDKMMFFDEDKHILVGAAMVPNKMIHRYDELGNLYYVFFSKESIKKMADKFLRQRRTDETSVEHDGKKLGADKVYVTESWIKEDMKFDKGNKYGFQNLPVGTWFVSMKVDDPQVWKMIKDKILTGFSVEGLFGQKSMFSKGDKAINQIKKILKSIKDDK
jgi:hypothetical protein